MQVRLYALLLISRFPALIAGALLAVLLAPAAPADAQTAVYTIDTSAIAGQSGYYEFQFVPAAGDGGSVTNAATMTLTGISYGSAPASEATLQNSGAASDDYTAADGDFGSTFSFDWSLDPANLPVVDTGDDLDLFFYTSSGAPVATTAPSGSNLAGVIQITPGANPGDPNSVNATAYQLKNAGPAAVPEQSPLATIALLAGLTGAAMLSTRLRRVQNQAY